MKITQAILLYISRCNIKYCDFNLDFSKQNKITGKGNVNNFNTLKTKKALIK